MTWVRVEFYAWNPTEIRRGEMTEHVTLRLAEAVGSTYIDELVIRLPPEEPAGE